MANKSLFKSIIGKMLPPATALNHEQSIAYEMSPKHKLAQYAATGCLNSTFYADATEQLDTVRSLCSDISPDFIAKLAIYARQQGYMKDMPALLCAELSMRNPELLKKTFPIVCDNGRMIRTFVQIMRSGAVGRKSLGSAPKKMVRHWLDTRSDEEIFGASVGNTPSVADIIRMTHPIPGDRRRAALYGYLLGQPHAEGDLPDIVLQFERFKTDRECEIPNVPFQMLTSLDLGSTEWAHIAKNAGWHMTRMNLNTFARHQVFDVEGMTELIAARLRDQDAIRKARVFPYQLMIAYLSAGEKVPRAVKNALQDAMEISISNIPVIDGKIYICPDVSGSMASPITGHRKGASTKARCIDVAALVAAALMRKNPEAEVLPFENRVVNIALNSHDSVMTNAEKLASIGGGGTNCSAPIKKLNEQGARGNLVVLVSDNESWVDNRKTGATALMQEWNIFKKRCPDAKLVCIDIQPNGTAQAVERYDILNVGGVSDAIFSLINTFAKGLGSNHWVDEIEAIAV